MDDPSPRSSRAEEVFEAFLLRREGDEAESPEELLTRHPELHAELEALFAQQAKADVALERAAPVPDPRREGGKLLGDHLLVREIGRGGMGIVYEAEQLSLNRLVAVKVLPAHVTLSANAVERFRREARIAASLKHDNIVDIYSVGESDGAHYFAMEFIEGTALDRVIERMRSESFGELEGRTVGDIVSIQSLQPSRRPTPDTKSKGSSAWNKGYLETVVRMVAQIADALEYAHQAGVTHRDVKPSNILLRPDGTALLTDFGLAHQTGLPSITQTGEFAGTVHYVSPEQAMAQRMRIDHRTDIFSLGATLYELLTLQHAFDGETPHDVLAQIISREPVAPSRLNPSLAPDLETIVLKALEKDPDRRYATAGEFADDLRAFLEYRPIQARRTPTVVRMARWVRREPAKAAVSALLVVGVPLLFVLGTRVLAQRSELQAVEARQELESGFLHLAEQHYTEAAKRFERVLELGPVEPEARVGLALTFLRSGQPEQALVILDQGTDHPAYVCIRAEVEGDGAFFESATTEDNPDDLALFLIGLWHLRRGTGERATLSEALSGSISDDRKEDDAPHDQPVALPDELLARAYDGEHLAIAVECFSAAISLADRPRALYHYARIRAAALSDDHESLAQSAQAVARFWPESPLALLHIGYARLEEEAFDSAVEALEGCIEADRELTTAHFLLAEALARQGRLGGALDAVARGVELAPEWAWGHFCHGRALQQNERWEEAVREYRRAIAIDPKLWEAHARLGETLLQSGREEGAIDALEEALALKPDDFRAVFNIGLAYYRSERLGPAIEYWRRAAVIEPKEARVHVNLAEALFWARAFQESAEHARRAVDLEGGPDGEPFLLHRGYYWRARALAASGDHPAARSTLESWTEAQPDYDYAWNELAWFCVDPGGVPEQRDPEAGLFAAERAVQLSGGADPAILDTLACAFFANGRVDEAIQVELRAFDLIPAADPNRLRSGIASNLERFGGRAPGSSEPSTSSVPETDTPR